MRTRMPAAERRAQLLTEALQIFGTHGFHESSMDQIAAAAGVTKPVLYQHFASKESLFEAVLRAAAERLSMATERALANASSAREQVEFAFGAILDVCASDPATFRVLFEERGRLDPSVSQQLADTQHALALGISAHLHGVGNDDEDLQLVLGHALVGMTEAALRYWFKHDARIDAAALKAQLIELAWVGLRGPRPL